MTLKRSLARAAIVVVAFVIGTTTTLEIAPHGISFDFGMESAEAERKRYSKPKTKRGKVLGKEAAQHVTEIQAAIEEGRNEDALAMVDAAIEKGGWVPYEENVFYQLKGTILISLEDYVAAREVFEKALEIGGLPEHLNNDLLFMIGQLYLAEGNGEKAVEYLEAWFAKQDDPTHQAYFAVSRAFLVAKDYESVLVYAEGGLEKAESDSIVMKLSARDVILLEQLYVKTGRPEKAEEIRDRFPGYFAVKPKNVKSAAAPSAQPIYRVNPEYPDHLAKRGVEGWVLLQFDIDVEGNTKNVRALDSDPPGVFDKYAIAAVEKWRYKKAIIDGQAMERREVQVVLTFEVDDN